MSEKTHEDKKEFIIKNFMNLVKKKGINGVTLNEVAEKSGFSKSAFYYYFKSKEDLIVSGFDSFNKKLKKKFISLLENVTSAEETIEIYVNFHIRLHSGEYEEFRHMTEMSNEAFYEIQSYIFNSPKIAKKILEHRDTELNWINKVIADYLNESPEDERTKKITLVFSAFLHSFIHLSKQISEQRNTLSSYSIMTDFPWKVDNVSNRDVFKYLSGGIDNLYKTLFDEKSGREKQ